MYYKAAKKLSLVGVLEILVSATIKRNQPVAWKGLCVVCVHAYMVVLASFAIGFLNWGIQQSFGTFLPFILERFSDKRSEASLIHSVLVAVTHIVGVASGAIVRRWGTGKLVFVGSIVAPLGFILSYFATSLVMLYIFIGLITGVGMSFTYVCAVITIGKLFSDRRQTAVLSTQNVSTGIGGIVLPYLLDWCIERYTLIGTFLLVGGLLLNNVACALVIRSSSRTYVNDSVRGEVPVKPTNVQVSPKSIVFVLFLVAETIVMSNSNGIYIMLLDILQDRGLSRTNGLHCLVAANVLGTLSRLLPLVTKVVFKDPMVALVISSAFGATGTIILLFGDSFISLMIGSICIGVCDGATSSSFAAVVFQIVRSDAQELCYGLILTAIGVITAGIGPLYGAIYDQTEAYTLVLLVACIIFGLGMLLVIGCIFLYHRSQPDVQDTKL